MQIATWNINGLRARLDFVLHWLASRRPDIVALQELKAPDEKFPHEPFEEMGYQAAIHGQKAWNGVGILSRSGLRVVAKGLPGQEEAGARLITAEVEGIRVTSLYCPNGKHVEHDDFQHKLAWYDSLLRYLQCEIRQDDAAVVCGDFNLCPGPLDSWDEEGLKGSIFLTREERSRFEALIDLGLIDLFRNLHPDKQAFSWWDYRDGAFHKNRGMRIDLLLGTRRVHERLESVEIDREYRKKKEGLTASDHAPVIATLR